MARGSPAGRPHQCARIVNSQFANRHLSTPSNRQTRARLAPRVRAVIVAQAMLPVLLLEFVHPERSEGSLFDSPPSPARQLTPAGWLRLGSRTQSSLRRSRRIVSWSSPCHPQGFFAGVTPEPGCPTRGTGREDPGSGISCNLPHREISASLFPASPRRRIIQSRKSLRRLQHIVRKEKFPVRRHHHDLHPVAQPLRHRQLHQHRIHLQRRRFQLHFFRARLSCQTNLVRFRSRPASPAAPSPPSHQSLSPAPLPPRPSRFPRSASPRTILAAAARPCCQSLWPALPPPRSSRAPTPRLPHLQ